MQNERHTIIGLQYLRAVACMMVLIYHMEILLPVPNIVGYLGHVGVRFFFIVSGFIIYYITHNRPFVLWDFIKKRIIRIYPMVWIISLVMMGINIIIYTHNGFIGSDYNAMRLSYIMDTIGYTMDIVVSSFTLIPFVEWGNHISNHDYPMWTYIISVSWTLTIEILFYSIFALGLYIQKHYKISVLYTVIPILILCTGLNGILQYPDIPRFVDLIIFTPHWLYFVIGISIAYIYTHKNTMSHTYIYIPITIICYAAAYILKFVFAIPHIEFLVFGVLVFCTINVPPPQQKSI